MIALALLSFALNPADSHAQSYEEDLTQDLILIVIKKPYLLSDGVIALERNGRVYLPVVELAQIMDFFVEEDVGRDYVNGWYLDPANTFSIDAQRLEIIHKGEKSAISEDDVIVEDFGFNEIYLSTELLNSIWPVTMTVDYSTLKLSIETERKLPFELKLEREARQEKAGARGEQIQTVDPETLPQYPNPYRFSTHPVADIQLTTELGDDLTSKATFTGAHDVLGLSAQYNMSADYSDGRFRRPANPRLRFRRKDIHGDALAFDWTQLDAGDIALQQRSLVGTNASGRGIYVSNSRYSSDTAFDTRVIEGTGPPGWDIELYNNNQLIEFGTVDEDGEYRFEDVQLGFGANRIRVVLYGTQGQVREDVQNINVGSRQLRPGELEYNLGAVQENRDLIELSEDDTNNPTGMAYSAYVARGFNEHFSLFGSYSESPTKQGRREFASVGAYYSALGGVGQVEAFKALDGGTAFDMRYLTRIKDVSLTTRAAVYRDFESEEAGFGSTAKTLELEATASKVLRTPAGALGLRLDADYQRLKNGSTRTVANFSQSMGLGAVRLTNNITANANNDKLTNINGRLNSNIRVKKWQFRGAANYNIDPKFELTTVQGDARYQMDDKTNIGMNFSHALQSSLTSVGAQYARDMEDFIGSIRGDWNSDGDASVTLQLTTSLGPYGSNGDYMFSSERLTGKSPVRATVFLDRNNDGIYDEGDEPLPNASLLVGGSRGREKTDENGELLELNVPADRLVAVQLDSAKLEDPYYLSVSKGFGVAPRVGTMPEFFFPVIETGAVDGTLLRASNAQPLSGVELQLVDEGGNVVKEVSTAYDGYYTFEFVPPGTYTVRPHPKYAEEGVEIPPETVEISMDELFVFGTDLELDDAEPDDGVRDSDQTGPDAPQTPDDAPQGAGEMPAGEKEATAGQAATKDLQQASSSTGTGAIAPRSGTSGLSDRVDRVRIGEHPQKTRIVLDLSGAIQYSHTLMPEGTRIVIDLPQTAWDALAGWRGRAAPLLESYATEALSGGGTRLILTASQPVRIGYHGIVGPEKGAGKPAPKGKGHRLVMDIYPRLAR